MVDVMDALRNVGLYLEIHEIPTSHLVIEFMLLLSLVWLTFSKRYRQHPPREAPLSPKEEDELIEDWVPEPLAKPVDTSLSTFNAELVAESAIGTEVTVDGKSLVNVGTYNFLDYVGDKRVEDAAIASVRKYGVGSCGPRGFYGTIDCHLELEEKLSEFLQVEEAILYSYGFATIASAIPAYSKRGDIIFCDEAVSFPIQKGTLASRSKVITFRHNDMQDLEDKLKKQATIDEEDADKARATRRFMIVEGIYVNTGQVAPLPKLIELKYKYKVRLFVEESYSFGVLGKTGRGVVEHFNADPVDVDMIAVSMGTALGSIGGFCAGRSYVIDHQRLSGQGYCFSASLPPLLANAAICTLQHLSDDEGVERRAALHANVKLVKSLLQEVPLFDVAGDDLSPLLHLYLTNNYCSKHQLDSFLKQDEELHRMVGKMQAAGFALTRAAYLRDEELFQHRPSIRLALSSGHSKDQLTKLAQAFKTLA